MDAVWSIMFQRACLCVNLRFVVVAVDSFRYPQRRVQFDKLKLFLTRHFCFAPVGFLRVAFRHLPRTMPNNDEDYFQD